MFSKNINYVPALDHLRFFAAMMIVIFHLANSELVHNLHLDIGVPLFFTLSGYLFFTIAYHHKNEEIIYWKFIYNRILRIYPLVILLFFITIVVHDNFTALDFFNIFGLNFPGVARKSWFIGDWGYQYLSFNWWTIGVEFTFYLLFPIIFKFYRQYGVIILLKLLLLLLILKTFLYYALLAEYGWQKLAICFNYSFFCNFDIFITGMITAHFANQISFDSPMSSFFKSKIALIFYVFFMWLILIRYSDQISTPLAALVTAILCGGLIVFYQGSCSNIQKENMLSRILSSLGSMSFSIYLLHDFIKNGLDGLGLSNWFLNNFFASIEQNQEITKFVLLFLYIPIILIISKLSFSVIEKPFLNMRVKYFSESKFKN